MAKKTKLPLVNRYQAALVEHAARVAQRQNALQIYLATVVAIFGFYFAGTAFGETQSDDAKPQIGVPEFLFWSTLFLSTSVTIIIWMHHHVMQNLCRFMSRCEKFCANEISKDGNGTNELFYFYDPDRDSLRGFHSRQRLLHRVLLSIMFILPCIAAAAITYNDIGHVGMMVGLFVLGIATMAAYADLHRDNGA